MSDFVIEATYGSDTAGIRIPADVFTQLQMPAPAVDAVRDEIRTFIGRWIKQQFTEALAQQAEAQIQRISNID